MPSILGGDSSNLQHRKSNLHEKYEHGSNHQPFVFFGSMFWCALMYFSNEGFRHKYKFTAHVLFYNLKNSLIGILINMIKRRNKSKNYLSDDK
jgi:hypothetical protein